jgi:hypothetical protein
MEPWKTRSQANEVYGSAHRTFADEIVPAQRQEKGIKQSTDGTTRFSAPMKVFSAGINCMIKKKTAQLSGQGNGAPQIGSIALTRKNHRLNSCKEENVHRSEALSRHDVHLPAQEYLPPNEACPDERPRTDSYDISHQR